MEIVLKIFSGIVSLLLPHNPVNTSLEAIRIAENIVHQKYPDINYDNYTAQVEFDQNTNEWCIFYMLNTIEGHPDNNIMGGGGPEIHLRKSDGKITKVVLQK